MSVRTRCRAFHSLGYGVLIQNFDMLFRCCFVKSKKLCIVLLDVCSFSIDNVLALVTTFNDNLKTVIHISNSQFR